METTQFTHNIPTAILPNLVDAIAHVDNYEQLKKKDETKIEFAKRKLYDHDYAFLKGKLEAHTKYLALEKAMVDSEEILTAMDGYSIT